MYLTTIENGGNVVEVHNHKHKLFSGSVVQGINTIDSFTFTALPGNPAFRAVSDFVTLVRVYNTLKARYEFQGRVLYSAVSMSEAGLIEQEVTCESFFGYFCDSQQEYVAERSWTRRTFWEHVLAVHNRQVEESKHFYLGELDHPALSIKLTIERENTWETITKKLLEPFGGEIRFREVDGKLYVDHLEKIGEEKSTKIQLSRNMKAITRERDPSSFVTRLIPLGAKLKNADGNETEERLDITEVNGGVNYIDDEEAIAAYGIHVGYKEFDDVGDPLSLMMMGNAWLLNNNKVLVKYSVTALDLSLLGLDMHDFEVHNSHPVENKFLDVDDVVRIVKKTIDICAETNARIEIGDAFKTLSELRREQNASVHTTLRKLNADVVVIRSNYVTNQTLQDYAKTEDVEERILLVENTITQQEESILLKVGAGYVPVKDFTDYQEATAAQLELKVGRDENDRIVSMLNASADTINITSDRLVIDSTYFQLSANGTVTGKNAVFESTTVNGTFRTVSGNTSTVISDGTLVSTATDPYGNGDNVEVRLDGLCLGIRNYIAATGRKAWSEFGRVGSVVSGGTIYANFGVKTEDFLSFTPGNACCGKLNGSWEAANAIEVTSDRRAKNSINTLSTKYSALFDQLRPVIFKYNNGRSGRYHLGFIAQEVAEAAERAGLSLEELAAVCAPIADGKYWGIRYEEFVALNTHEIQTLKTQVARLEERMATL